MSETLSAAELLRLTVNIVSAHVAQNTLPPGELPQLISRVHTSLVEIGDTGGAGAHPGGGVTGLPGRNAARRMISMGGAK